jgi:hypothetical protein
MADDLTFPPIPSTTPEVKPPEPATTYDTWALNRCEIRRQKDPLTGAYTFELATNWILGRMTGPDTFEPGPKQTNYMVRDMLGAETLAEHPEIGQISPAFIGGLVAIGKRLGQL